MSQDSHSTTRKPLGRTGKRSLNLASADGYAAAVLLDGSFTGHSSQALDNACTLYLADTGWHPQ
jgi:hypothetical protein